MQGTPDMQNHMNQIILLRNQLRMLEISQQIRNVAFNAMPSFLQVTVWVSSSVKHQIAVWRLKDQSICTLFIPKGNLFCSENITNNNKKKKQVQEKRDVKKYKGAVPYGVQTISHNSGEEEEWATRTRPQQRHHDGSDLHSPECHGPHRVQASEQHWTYFADETV